MDDQMLPSGPRPTVSEPQPEATPVTSNENNNQTISGIGIPPVTPNPQPTNRRKRWLWVIVAVILVLAGLGAVFIATHDKKLTSNSSQGVVKKDIPNVRFVSTLFGWGTFYPASENTSTYTQASSLFFESLVRYENKTQIVPLLATGWTNPDDSTWVFTLKKGVKFHTNREMTADDVKASIEGAKDTVWGETFGNTITSVSVNDRYKVTIKTDGPDPTLLKKMIFLNIYDTKSGKEADPVNGTGPFVVKQGTTPKENSLEAVAFDHYHGGHVYVRSVSFAGKETDTIADDFNKNQADLTDIPVKNITRAHNSLTVEPNAVFLLLPNTTRANSPLAKLKVRQAMYLASDAQALSKAREEAGTPVGQVVPSSIPGYNPDVHRPARDVAKAKTLLSEAGYPKGITITYTYYSRSPSTADELKRQMAEAGITVKLDPRDDVKLFGDILKNGSTDLMSQTYSSDILDSSDVLGNYADYPFYKNEEVLNLLSKAQNTFDSSKRLTTLQQANKAMADDLGVIPMYSPNSSPIIFDKSYVIQRDINDSNTLGFYWSKVYAQ